jgi:hypothetical protein
MSDYRMIVATDNLNGIWNQEVEDEHTMPKEKDKMTNTNLQKKTKVRFSGRVNSFYSRCGTRRRAISVTYIVMFSRLCVRVVILFAWWKRLHDRIISPRGEVWTLKTSLTPSLFMEVPESSQERELSFICVLRVSIFSLSTICWL